MNFVSLENYWKSMAVHRISTNKQNGDIASLNIGQNAISSISVANCVLMGLGLLGISKIQV